MPSEADFPSDLRALEDEYELIRELGHGGMAAVYLARKRMSGQLVAIKAIRARYLDDQDALQRFAREAHTVADLDHPNIVRTEAIEQIDDRAIAIIMEHVPGGTLRDRLREHGALGAEHAESVLRDVAAALAYAHRRGIIHRDVKPENVFLDATQGRALLSDFGIARRIEGDTDITLLGAALGTPQYMSPEQIDGTQLDGRSDVYSLGIVGWEILTGRRPWAGENLYGVIYKQKHEDLPRITTLRPRVPANLLFAIEGALMKDRAKRWRSADEFIERLTYNPPPVLAQDYPAGASPPDDQPTVVFRRTALVPAVDGGGHGAVAAPPRETIAPVVLAPVATPIARADRSADPPPFTTDSYSLPTFGHNADASFEVDPPRTRVLRGLTLVGPLALAALSLYVVLGGSSRDAPRADATRIASGGTVAGDTTRLADSPDRSRPVPTIAFDTATVPGTHATAGGVLLSPPRGGSSSTTAPLPPTARAGDSTSRLPSRAPVSRERPRARAAAPGMSPSPGVRRDAVADSLRAVPARNDALTDSATGSVALEDPFRPPTTPPATAGEGSPATTRSTGAPPSPRCRLASTADQRACLDSYVAIGDAPMQRAFDALIVEMRHAAGVASGALDPPSVERVRVEQRAWLSVRNGECRRQPSADEGPFWAPLHAQCYSGMAAYRASELQDAVRRLRRR